MSSETSTDSLTSHGVSGAGLNGPRGGPQGSAPQVAGDAFEPWQLFTLAGLIGATVVVFVSRGQTPAGIILLSVTIFSAAIVGVAMWRTLAPFTGSDERTGPLVVGGRTRAALEREKALTLRSIKALEFDRAMGKVSDKDFAEMSTLLRARAARLMRQLDAGTGYRGEIEKEIARRVGKAEPPVARTLSGSRGEPEAPDHAGVRGGDPASARPTGDVEPTVKACPGCSKNNDLDARFCKHCGASVA